MSVGFGGPEGRHVVHRAQVIRTRNGVGETNWNGNPGSPESALLDWKLLTECDDLLITVGSSFGQIAAAYSGAARNPKSCPPFVPLATCHLGLDLQGERIRC